MDQLKQPVHTSLNGDTYNNCRGERNFKKILGYIDDDIYESEYEIQVLEEKYRRNQISIEDHRSRILYLEGKLYILRKYNRDIRELIEI